MPSPLKLHKSIPDQIALLESRGLIINDKKYAASFLERVNYYRFTGYLHDYRKSNSDDYISGIKFSDVARMYEFDMKFTRLLMYVLEDIEETLKTRFSYSLSSAYPLNPLIYLDDSIYKYKPALTKFKYLFTATKSNNMDLPFIKHHYNVYGGDLPIWVAVEIMTMGNLHALYGNLITPLQKDIAKKYNTGATQLNNWIENLTYTRNHLAHYMRIYNYNFGRIPKSCKNHPINAVYRGRIFDQIAVMSFMYSKPDDWNNYVIPEMDALITEYSDVIKLSGLGLPNNWKQVLKII